MKIAIASDHAGYARLEMLREYLIELGHQPVDFGPHKLSPSDDYPDFIIPAAKAVASGECVRAIVFGGDGEGEAMAANRVKGIRCAVFYGPAVARQMVDANGRTSHDPFEIVKLTRLHNDANVLALASRFLLAADIKHAVKLWLETDFSHQPRHLRRIQKLDKEIP